jgi:hypothetical protein
MGWTISANRLSMAALAIRSGIILVFVGTKKRARGPLMFPGGAFGVDPKAPLLRGI